MVSPKITVRGCRILPCDCPKRSLGTGTDKFDFNLTSQTSDRKETREHANTFLQHIDTLKEINSQTDQYLVNLSSKTYYLKTN